MPFRSANIVDHLTRFNSAASSDFLDYYESLIDADILAANSEPKHRTIAPSSFRCERINWFRLRGVHPDKIEEPDRGLEFTANMGTACHEIIQDRLSRGAGAKWIKVSDHLASIRDEIPDYEYTVTSKGYESLVELTKPYPIRFACDGIVDFKNTKYIIEIKSSDFSSFQDLTKPKDKHVGQGNCYSTLLRIPNVLFIYIDRQFGGLKCFEHKVSYSTSEDVKKKLSHIVYMAEANLAPDKLPSGDSWCTPSMCPYYHKCKEW